jgi:dihydroorotase
VSRKLGINGLPASAEVAVIARDIALLEETGARYHVQHLSTAGGVELVRRAKESGLDVTAEVTPHHLAFTEEELLGMSTNMKMYPPLREPRDREALVSGVLDRTIDAIATDHAPHSSSEKDVPFEDAPRGVIGLETAFAATLGALGGDLDLVFEAMSMAPARIAGLGSHGRHIRPGAPANLVLVDPTEQWTAGDYVSRSSNSPFTGLQMKGRVVATIVGGQIRHGVAK